MVTVWRTVLMLSGYYCDSTHQHYDVTQFEYVLWRHTMHEWVMNIHYKTWIAQGRFTNMILTPSKQWGVCDKSLDQPKRADMLIGLKYEYFIAFCALKYSAGYDVSNSSKTWTSYQIRKNGGLGMRRECREYYPRHRLQWKPLVSDPSMHHDTCVTHVPWCISGSLNCGGGENVLGIPGACAIRNIRYMERDPRHVNRFCVPQRHYKQQLVHKIQPIYQTTDLHLIFFVITKSSNVIPYLPKFWMHENVWE